HRRRDWTRGTSFYGLRRKADASLNGRVGQRKRLHPAGAEQQEGGADDGGGLQAEGAVAEPGGAPAGELELAPLGGIEPSLGADQQGGDLGLVPRDEAGGAVKAGIAGGLGVEEPADLGADEHHGLAPGVGAGDL